MHLSSLIITSPSKISLKLLASHGKESCILYRLSKLIDNFETLFQYFSCALNRVTLDDATTFWDGITKLHFETLTSYAEEKSETNLTVHSRNTSTIFFLLIT